MKFILTILILSLSVPTCLIAQEMAPQLNYNTARIMLDGCMEYAKSKDYKVSIAVFDAHGQLISFARMDGASVSTSELARWKGLSAANYQFPSEQTAKWGGPAPNMSTFGGGLPFTTKNGEPLGGIGVSGAPTEADIMCGKTGIEKAGLMVKE